MTYLLITSEMLAAANEMVAIGQGSLSLMNRLAEAIVAQVAPAKSCEGCGCDAHTGECPGKMRAAPAATPVAGERPEKCAYCGKLDHEDGGCNWPPTAP
jgi:hypothetical protein